MACDTPPSLSLLSPPLAVKISQVRASRRSCPAPSGSFVSFALSTSDCSLGFCLGYPPTHSLFASATDMADVNGNVFYDDDEGAGHGSEIDWTGNTERAIFLL